MPASAAKTSKAGPYGRLDVIDTDIKQAIDCDQIQGAVVLVGHHGRVVYRKAFGYRALEPRHARMTLDTIFDLASLAKVVGTTTALMQLVEQGEVRPHHP